MNTPTITTNQQQSSIRCSRTLALLALLLFPMLAGCRWNQWLRRTPSDAAPIVFSSTPSLEEVAGALNAQTSRVQSLQTQGATVSVAGFPALSAELAVERPRKLRMRAGTSLLGPELDLGMNDELFWFWAARNPQPGIYYARHDRFATSPLRSSLAVDPSWVTDALGLVSLPPIQEITGPSPVGKDRVELRWTVMSPSGPMQRLVQVHAKHGWIVEQHLYDPRGTLLVTSKAGDHQYSAVDGIALPRHVELNIPAASLNMSLDVASYSVNMPFADGATLFELPSQSLGNVPLVDIADPATAAAMGGTTAPPPAGAMPIYSGQPVPGQQLPGMPASAPLNGATRYRGMPQYR